MDHTTKIVILAAGKGKRMGADLPKPLIEFQGKPMIAHLLDSITPLGITPIIVVSPDNIDLFKKYLSAYDVEYALQTEQLGTGHAVASARDQFKDAQHLVVLYGDHPFIKTETLEELVSLQVDGAHPISMMTVQLEDFNDWRQNFYHWGRIVRNENDTVEAIVEFKDATEEQKQITEVNPALYSFQVDWLLRNIDRIRNENKSGEYYLTDLIALAREQNHDIETCSIDPRESVGINTPEELEIAEQIQQ